MIVPSCAYFPDKKFRFLLLKDFEIETELKTQKEYNFYNKEYHLAVLKNGKLKIFKDFWWDGCSPSQVFGVSKLSIPSPVETLAASLCHDLYYQFLNIKYCPWDRKFADKEFKRLLLLNKFKFTYVYYFSVKYLGGYFVRDDADLSISVI